MSVSRFHQFSRKLKRLTIVSDISVKPVSTHGDCDCDLGSLKDRGSPLEWLEESDIFMSDNDEPVKALPEHVRNILRGSMVNLPHMPSTTVRIFLSSTFTGK